MASGAFDSILFYSDLTLDPKDFFFISGLEGG